MNPEEYTRMFQLEDHYWWFVARRRLALALLFHFVNGSEKKVMDLGCGTGVVLHDLAAEKASPVGVDMNRLALGMSRSRGEFDLVQADGTALPFEANSFDAAIGLDVFEHIKDDVQAFRECARVLKPGGILVLSVPAFKWLWSPHDVALHHFRRYRAPEMRERLLEAGLEPIKLSYSVFFLFPLVLLVRCFERNNHGEAKASLPKVPEWLNRFLIRLGDLEASLLRGIRLPWGSSVIAVARKP